MKKEFKDLSIEEFVRVLCGIPKKHTFKIQTFDTETGEGLGDERDLITGDYWTLYRYFSMRSKSDEEYIRLDASRIIDDLEKSYFDYEVEYSMLDVYNYLDNKTNRFDRKRCNILKWDMLVYKCHITEELDKCEINDERFFAFQEAIGMLLNEISSSKDRLTHDEQQLTTLPKELDIPKARAIFEKAIKEGYITPKENFLQWHLSNTLLAYLCGKLYSGDTIYKSKFRKDEYKKGELPFPEKSIKELFHDKNGKPLENIKESRNGLISSPRGYEVINRLFEEAAE